MCFWVFIMMSVFWSSEPLISCWHSLRPKRQGRLQLHFSHVCGGRHVALGHPAVWGDVGICHAAQRSQFECRHQCLQLGDILKSGRDDGPMADHVTAFIWHVFYHFYHFPKNSSSWFLAHPRWESQAMAACPALVFLHASSGRCDQRQCGHQQLWESRTMAAGTEHFFQDKHPTRSLATLGCEIFGLWFVAFWLKGDEFGKISFT